MLRRDEALRTVRDEWAALWKSIGAEGDVESAYAGIEEKYLEKHRHYHDIFHVYQGLLDLNNVLKDSKNPDALAAAWILHDVIYKPLSQTNENDSADYTARIFSEARVPYPFIRDVCRLILVTDHKTPPITRDEKIIVCNDLAILGKPEHEFDAYDDGIFAEYVTESGVPEEVFREKRPEILAHFLDRSRHGGIYTVGYYKSRYEAQARKNLERATARWRTEKT